MANGYSQSMVPIMVWLKYAAAAMLLINMAKGETKTNVAVDESMCICFVSHGLSKHIYKRTVVSFRNLCPNIFGVGTVISTLGSGKLGIESA